MPYAVCVVLSDILQFITGWIISMCEGYECQRVLNDNGDTPVVMVTKLLTVCVV